MMLLGLLLMSRIPEASRDLGEILQTRQLAKAENRRLFAGQIDRMKAHDERAYGYIRKMAE